MDRAKEEVSQRSPARVILLVLALTMLGFGSSIVYAQRTAARLDANAISVATNASPAIKHLVDARRELFRVQTAVSTFDPRSRPAATTFEASLSRLRADLAAYRAISFYAGEAETYAEVDRAVHAFEVKLESGAALVDVSAAATRADEALERLITFNTEQQYRLSMEIPRLRRDAAQIGYLLQGVTIASAFVLMTLIVRGTRKYAAAVAQQKVLAEERANDLESFGIKLRSIIESTTKIGSGVASREGLEATFRTVAAEARAIVDADYSAVGYGTDPSLPFEPWAFSGIDVEHAKMNAKAPRPIGLLGAVMKKGRPIRVDEMTTHPEFRGLPPGHVAMGPFLGVPLTYANDAVGNLYLARKPGRPPFTEEDERAARLLAIYVGVALHNARLYGEAYAATRSREDLLAVVSHDLKNPLNVVLMSVSLLQTPAAKEKEKAAQLAARIERAAQRMARLIADLLDSAKIEAHLFEATPRPERVAPLVGEAVDTFSVAADEKGVHLSTRVEADGRRVLCEKDLALRVFSNLIGNALKFTPPGGTIEVAAEPSGSEEVDFSVRDTGPGISPEYLPHLFERYSQQKSGDRRGSGLGLFIAKGIVEAHGGRIWADSRLGHGTTVHFTLRTASREPNAAPSSASALA